MPLDISSTVHDRASVLRAQLTGDPDGIVTSAFRLAAFAARKVVAEVRNRGTRAPGYIEHFGVHQPLNNAGDTVLFEAIEQLFDTAYGRRRWRRTQLRRDVTERDVSRMNAAAKALLVGGGGLLISDTNANAVSGWQWKISRELLEQLEVPLIVFAIGYNRFRDGAVFPPMFQPHLEATVAKSVFFGARNAGSVEQIRSHLPGSLQSRVVFQPCMTTVLRCFHSSLQATSRARFSKRLAINLAFDRPTNRYGTATDETFARIRSIVKWALDDGWDVVAALHSSYDDPIGTVLHGLNGRLRLRRLNLASPDDIVRFYASMPVTLGMRGHAQMIPFGCGNALFSIVSHDKMNFFLQDIGRPDWGADVFDRELADKAIAFLANLERSWDVVSRHIDAEQARFWAITNANLATIGRAAGWAAPDSRT
jgi:hypothetical protein